MKLKIPGCPVGQSGTIWFCILRQSWSAAGQSAARARNQCRTASRAAEGISWTGERSGSAAGKQKSRVISRIGKIISRQGKSVKTVRIRLAKNFANKIGFFPINEPEFETAKWYINIKKKCWNHWDFSTFGASDWARTSGLQSRSLTLYPTELRALIKYAIYLVWAANVVRVGVWRSIQLSYRYMYLCYYTMRNWESQPHRICPFCGKICAGGLICCEIKV